MPSNEKEEPLEKLKDKLPSRFGSKKRREKNKAFAPKTHFSSWHPLYCYGKERSQFNGSKKE